MRIAYEMVGEGEPIVLVHGFASDRVQNWRAPGWYETLTDAGYRVVAIDCRGHGESDKPHDPAAYGHARWPSDVVDRDGSGRIGRAASDGLFDGRLSSACTC